MALLWGIQKGYQIINQKKRDGFPSLFMGDPFALLVGDPFYHLSKDKLFKLLWCWHCVPGLSHSIQTWVVHKVVKTNHLNDFCHSDNAQLVGPSGFFPVLPHQGRIKGKNAAAKLSKNEGGSWYGGSGDSQPGGLRWNEAGGFAV